jgi:hypothetical protein
MKNKSDDMDAAQPEPREAYGHPVTSGAQVRFSDHKPGHDESPAPVQDADLRGDRSQTAFIAPHNPAKIDKTSLSERIRQGVSGKDNKQ